MTMQANKAKNNRQVTGGKSPSELQLYPVDLSQLVSISQTTLDTEDSSSNGNSTAYDATIIAQIALIRWNQYVETDNDIHREAFLKQALWLVEHETRISGNAGGWFISFSQPNVFTQGSCLSALTQGIAVSVLLRAYQLTNEVGFFDAAHRAVATFEQDILDGGLSTPIGSEGIFFEEIAAYPAAHMLTGFIFGLLGLFDYLTLTGDTHVGAMICRGHVTMHELLEEFDAGYWTYNDLLHRSLTSFSHLTLQVALLKALADYAECEKCMNFASSWRSYQKRFYSRLRYQVKSHYASYSQAILSRFRTLFFPSSAVSNYLQVCVPVTAFPVMGGIRTVLNGLAQITEDIWRVEYLTQYVGPNPDRFVIHQFGTSKMFSSQFPNVWLYCITGFCKLMSLMHRNAGYHVILPQDGVFTAAFTGLVAKLAGVRVVCIDHGNLTLINNQAYRIERIKALETKHWSRPRRLLGRLRYACYWPSLRLLAVLASRFVDHFLIPGVEGDGVEESCIQLGIRKSRITRFASVINIDRHVVLDSDSRSKMRVEKGIAADAIVISMVCRLAPEKGIEIALEALSQSMAGVSEALRERVQVIIAGDGPLRKHVEEDIYRRGLSHNCVLWEEISTTDVLSLLSISDIFLYTSTRGACFSMSVLEAMASGCAVIASIAPKSNAHLLADGRGIAIPPGDAEQTGKALIRLISDTDCRSQMGRLARDYIIQNHNATLFRRNLIRSTYWSELYSLLQV